MGRAMGLDRSIRPSACRRSKEPARIVLKPSRAVTVRVKDAADARWPVRPSKRRKGYSAPIARPERTAERHCAIPADAQLEWVIAFRPRAGFDYFREL